MLRRVLPHRIIHIPHLRYPHSTLHSFLHRTSTLCSAPATSVVCHSSSSSIASLSENYHTRPPPLATMSSATTITPATDSIHTASSSGFSYQSNHLYDAGRPAYSDEVVDWLLEQTVLTRVKKELESEPSSTATPRVIRLVDSGAGTGIFTRCLHNRLSLFLTSYSQQLAKHQITFEITAIEPVEGMRMRFKENLPHIRCEDGSGSSMPTLADHSIAVIFAAQAFHWFATHASLKEFKRVLLPSVGCFAPVWNTRDLNVRYLNEMEKIIVPYYVDTPRQQTKEWKKVFLPNEKGETLLKLEVEKEWENTMVQVGDLNMVLARILSVSVIAALPAEKQEEVKQQLIKIIETDEETKGKKEFKIPYTTDAYVYRVKD